MDPSPRSPASGLSALGSVFRDRPQTPGEEAWNTITAAIGLIASAAAAIALAVTFGDTKFALAAFVYGGSLLALHGSSTFYHFARPDSPAKPVLQKLDHCAIFVLIAGTYTPFAARLDAPAGPALLVFQWGFVAVGCLLQWGNPPFFRKVSTILYIAMGWGGLVFWPAIMADLPAGALGGMLAGGLAYTLGVIFYAAKSRPFLHAVWHLFVLAGSAIHFFAVWRFAFDLPLP